MAEDLMRETAALGITTDYISGTYQDPNDPLVYIGGPRAPGTSGGVLAPAAPVPRRASAAAMATGNIISEQGGYRAFTGSRTKPLSEVEMEFYAKGPEELGELQRRMFNAGLYGNTKAEDIAFGDYNDERGFQAWQALTTRAARFYKVGKTITPEELLDQALGLAGPEGRGARDDGSERPKRAPLVIEMPSPDDLANVAQKTAVSTLGRGLRPDELKSFVAAYQSQLASYQQGAYAAANPEGGGGTVTAPASAGVAAEAFARRQNPTEANAHDFANVYDAFARLISKGVVGGAGG